MRALLEVGIDLEIFAFYPLDSQLWRYVPGILNERVFSRAKVHHIGLVESLRYLRPLLSPQLRGFVNDTAAISASAVRLGIMPLIKTIYGFPKAWAWGHRSDNDYDHVLAYWGNYAATNAYLFHRLVGRSIPFSMFLHAGMDLYDPQVFMHEKLLYADNIIVVCDYNRRFLEEHYGDIFPRISHKVHKYHLGLDLNELRYQPANRETHKILAVGYFGKYKGFDYLLRSGRVLHERGVSFTIDLIGDGEEAGALRTLAAVLGLQGKVRFLGQLPFERVQAAMSEATVLVHPSNGAGDAVPTVIKEAMALGLPVIASDVVGIPELLDHGRCGRLVPPRDVQALSTAIEELLSRRDLRRTYAAEGRKFAELTFNLWKNAGDLARLLSVTTRPVTV
jgi:colanic acid/amylovoran biosynthesis glycosyltransferase